MSPILTQPDEPYHKEGYHAFLLRCWQEGKEWRFSLSEVAGEQRRLGFPDLDALVAFLRREVMGERKQDK